MLKFLPVATWAEIGKNIPGLGSQLENNGWPVPTDAEFWKWIRPDEVLPIITDQLPKYLKGNLELEKLVARSYLLAVDLGAAGDETRISAVIAEGRHYDSGPVELILGGPLASVIFDRYHLRPTEKNLSLPAITSQSPDLVEKLKHASPAERALAWWGLWSFIENQYTRSRSGYAVPPKIPPLTPEQGVDFMISQLDLTPPQII